MSDRYRCGLLFGAPGVGKGTQGKRLGGQNGFVHLATGDMFRALDKDSALGRQFMTYSSRGELVPDELTIRLFRAHVGELVKTGRYDPARDLLLLDGVPRSLAQARMLDPHIEPLLIVHLVAPDLDEMVRRMRRRAEQEGRHDDADERVVRRRFEVYEAETAPLLHHYDAKLIAEVNALGTVEEVAGRVHRVVHAVYARAFDPG